MNPRTLGSYKGTPFYRTYRHEFDKLSLDVREGLRRGFGDLGLGVRIESLEFRFQDSGLPVGWILGSRVKCPNV